MKKLLVLLMSTTMFMTSMAFSGCQDQSNDKTKQPGKAPVKKDSAFSSVSMTAKEVAEKMGIGLNLGNTMEAYPSSNCDKITYEWMPIVGNNTPIDYETCWGAIETTQEIIDGIKACGFKTVRIPVYWGNMMENDGNWKINDDYIARVKEIVDYCINDDLFVVVNCHHFDEFIIRRHNTEECVEIFTNLWTQIAEYFKDYPYNLVFEGFNEYLGGAQFNELGELKDVSLNEGYKLTNACNQAFVDAVRATGSYNADRVLIFCGYNTNIDRTTNVEFKVPTDTVKDRLMVSVHYVDNIMYWMNSIGNKGWIDYTDSQIKLLEDAFLSNGIPVFMGETSSGYPESRFAGDAIYKDSSECLEIILTKLMEKGIIPIIWDTCDNFYSRTNCMISSKDNEKVIKKMTE